MAWRVGDKRNVPGAGSVVSWAGGLGFRSRCSDSVWGKKHEGMQLGVVREMQAMW